MLADKNNILRFIPQRAPFVMVDELISAGEDGFSTSFEVREDNIFLSGGRLSESAVIENIAQTCAAGFGAVNSSKGVEPGGLGFIGAVSKVVVMAEAVLGDRIETSVKVLNSFANVYLVEGFASAGQKDLLRCQMKIVLA